MIDKANFNPTSSFNSFKLRSTGETVEVIAFNVVEDGKRSHEDWVTYIDAEGNEHIKENLHIYLDFKSEVDFDKFYNTMSKPFENSYKLPSTENSRLFELTKELVVHSKIGIDEAIETAKKVVLTLKDIDV